MIDNFKEYPYLKDKKELFEEIIDENFEFIIDTYYSSKITTNDDFIVAFKKGLKRTIYNFYRNNRLSCIDDNEIKLMFENYLDDNLYYDIPTMNYYYDLYRNIESRLTNNGSYIDNISYSDTQKDTTQTNTSGTSDISNETNSTDSITSKDTNVRFSKSADTPSITSATDTYVDKYTNEQSKDTTTDDSSNESISSSKQSSTNTINNITDKSYNKTSEYNKTISHNELNSLTNELDLINKAKNNLIKSYVNKLSMCFIGLDELYDIYEGDE